MAPLVWLRGKWRQLRHLQAEPHAVALGVAAGVFFGFTPLWGLKTLLAMLAARLMRGSVLAAAIAVTLHDVVLPLMPLLFRWEYDVGYWVLSHPHVLPPHMHLRHHHTQEWFRWSTFLTVGRPLLLGSILLGLPVAIATYYLTRTLIDRLEADGRKAKSN
jgi:uncharacterized protein (DUF2062 family)